MNRICLLEIDQIFTEKHSGKFLLQTEDKGQLWYINPSDGKRYFVSDPIMLFDIISEIGVGISEEDFERL